MQQPVHYTTGNRPLAHALACAGFELLTVWNHYTPAKLDELGEASAVSAHRNGKPGVLTYVFRRDDDIEKAALAWDSAGVSLSEGNPIKTKVERAVAIQFVRAAIETGGPFRDVWKMSPPIFVEPSEDEITTKRGFENGREYHGRCKAFRPQRR